MPSQGPRSPNSVVNDGSAGSVSWTNPQLAQASDNQRASVIINSFSPSVWLKATGFGFSIPSNAAVTGIEVAIERRGISGFLNIIDAAVQLVKGGSFTGENKATSTPWTNSDLVVTYGGPNDTWGESWTANDINSSSFGVGLRVRLDGFGSDAEAYVDHIQITVYYTVLTTTVSPSGIASVASVGHPQVEPGHRLLKPVGFVDPGAVGTPFLIVPRLVILAGIESSAALGTPLLFGGVPQLTVTPVGIDGTAETGIPLVRHGTSLQRTSGELEIASLLLGSLRIRGG